VKSQQPALSANPPALSAKPASRPLSLTDLERLHRNYQQAVEAGQWQRPLLTPDQHQTAAHLLAELALITLITPSAEDV